MFFIHLSYLFNRRQSCCLLLVAHLEYHSASYEDKVASHGFTRFMILCPI